jgi:hypothetical protein
VTVGKRRLDLWACSWLAPLRTTWPLPEAARLTPTRAKARLLKRLAEKPVHMVTFLGQPRKRVL